MEAPANWPIKGISLPAGATDADFYPTALAGAMDKLPRKRFRNAPEPLHNTTWNAMFNYAGKPQELFDYFDGRKDEWKLKATEAREEELGTANESRLHTYRTLDNRYELSVRYWAFSATQGSKPYQLVIRDLQPGG